MCMCQRSFSSFPLILKSCNDRLHFPEFKEIVFSDFYFQIEILNYIIVYLFPKIHKTSKRKPPKEEALKVQGYI